MGLLLGIGAGIYKTARDTPDTLLDTVSSVTYGSFCSTSNEGNANIPTEKTEIFDPDTMTSLNAKGLPNQGLEPFLRDEIPIIVQQFQGKLAQIRVSISPRKEGELQDMVKLIHKYGVQDSIILEVNLACPNHRTEGGNLSPILARDPDAVNERLKEMSAYTGRWEFKVSPDSDYMLLNRLVWSAKDYGASGIVAGNTRPGDGTLAGKKLHPDVKGGGLGGAVLLSSTLTQVRQLQQLIQSNGADIVVRACGGATDAQAVRSINQYQPAEIQAVTVPYFLGPKAMAQLVVDSHS